MATFYVLMVLIGTTKGYQWSPADLALDETACEALATPEYLKQHAV
jgi:hypothetical protein